RVERMLEEQDERVLDVLRVDLDDLGLLEQEVGRRDRRIVEPEPVPQRDRVTEEELVEEDVDDHAGARLGERVALALRRDEQVVVDHVPAALEEPASLLSLPAVGGQVHVGQVALHLLEEPDVSRTVKAVSEGTQDAELDSLLPRLLDEV